MQQKLTFNLEDILKAVEYGFKYAHSFNRISNDLEPNEFSPDDILPFPLKLVSLQWVINQKELTTIPEEFNDYIKK